MVAALLAVAGLVFAYIGGEIMTFEQVAKGFLHKNRKDKILERLSMIEGEIDNHEHTISLLEDEQEHLLEELKEIQERDRIAEDRAWRQMKI